MPQQDISILFFGGGVSFVNLPQFSPEDFRQLSPCALSVHASPSLVSSSLSLTSAALNGLSLNGAPCGCSKSGSAFKNKDKKKQKKKTLLWLWSIYLTNGPELNFSEGMVVQDPEL